MSAHPSLAALAALTVSLVITVVTVRQVSIGRSQVAAAQLAAGRSDWPEAIARARAAAEALVPGSPWPDQGKRRLEEIGAAAEARGDDETALLAYGALRSAVLATRSPIALWSSSERWRTIAETGLAHVAGASLAGTPRAATDAMLEDLRRVEPVRTWKILLLSAASVALLGGLAWLAWPGTSADDVRRAQAVALLGFVAYAFIVLVA